MVKAKKKTKWRSLNLKEEGEPSEDGTSSKSGQSTLTRMDWKVNGENNENGFHHNGINGTRSRRDGRPPSTKYSKYHTRPIALQSQTNAQHTEPKKVQFNEDEYTKITTPRQDVLFKKGYLSRPKVRTTATTENASLSTDSTPSTNGVSSLDGEIPYYQSPYMSDPLMNGNFLGNSVVFLPYTDLYYPPVPQGIDTDSTYVAPYPFSPPLEGTNSDIASPQPLTSTNCSETSELSEDTKQNGRPLSTSSTPPIATTVDDGENDARSTNMQTTTTMTASPIHSGYDMSQQQPYFAPVYYVNFDMSYYPYQAYEMPEFYPMEVAPAEVLEEPNSNGEVTKTISSSSGTSMTDFSSEDDLPHEQQAAITESIEPVVPSDIFKIADQSTLNVAVEEFKPKSYETQLKSSKTDNKPKKVSNGSNSTATTTAASSAAPNPVSSSNNTRKRTTLDKKFIRESTKQFEMQNIDLSKSSKPETVDTTIEWVIKGGKRVPIKVEMPPPPPPSEPKEDPPEAATPPVEQHIQKESSVPKITSTTSKRANKKAKPKKNPKNKNGMKTNKLDGFVIEEPIFAKTESRVSETAVQPNDNDEDDDELQEVEKIEEIPWTEAELYDIETEDVESKVPSVEETLRHEIPHTTIDDGDTHSPTEAIVNGEAQIPDLESESEDCVENASAQEPKTQENGLVEEIPELRSGSESFDLSVQERESLKENGLVEEIPELWSDSSLKKASVPEFSPKENGLIEEIPELRAGSEFLDSSLKEASLFDEVPELNITEPIEDPLEYVKCLKVNGQGQETPNDFSLQSLVEVEYSPDAISEAELNQKIEPEIELKSLENSFEVPVPKTDVVSSIWSNEMEQVEEANKTEFLIPEVQLQCDEVNTQMHEPLHLEEAYKKLNGFALHCGLNDVPEVEEEDEEIVENVPLVLEHNSSTYHYTHLETLEEVDEPSSMRNTPETDILPEEVTALNQSDSISVNPECDTVPQIASTSPPVSITPAVVTWLETFTQLDKQSLFTIPLNADFLKKVRYCGEISNHFKDNSDFQKFLSGEFYQYQLEMLSDSSYTDDDEEDDDDEQSCSHGTQKKFFGCKTM